MALATEYIDDGRGLLHTGSGIVTGQELVNSAAQVLHDIRGGLPICYALIDLTDIAGFEVSSENIRDVAKINLSMAEVIGPARVAVVAAHDIAYGMARMWEAYAHTTAWQTQVFRDRIAAENWLTVFRHHS
jgi:uncharacterized membrane protein (DUF2068 family)